MKEKGLFYPNGSFRTTEQVKIKRAFEDSTGIRRLTDFPPERDFERWTEVITRRQAERQEVLGIPEHIEIEIKTRRPVLVSLFGDVHAGGEEVDYERFAKDVDLTKSVEGYSITVGDLTESGFFMPIVDEHLMSGEEQRIYMKSALNRLSEDDRLIAGFAGDHDLWGKDKMGAHGLYQDFHERYNAHYLEGVSYLTIDLNNEEEIARYRLVGSHQHKGFSIYNDSHAALRQEKDEGRGADLTFTAHRHVKGYNQQTIREHPGVERVVHMLSIGCYKKTDRYSRKKGWPRKAEESMGAFGIILHPGEKKIDVNWTIKEAVKILGRA